MNRKADLISKAYFLRYRDLGERKYHYMVRSSLFEGRHFTLEEFDNYFGNVNKSEWLKTVEESTSETVASMVNERAKYAHKYQDILLAEQILVRGIVGEKLFKLRPTYPNGLDEAVYRLMQDRQAIGQLSSYAVNVIVVHQLITQGSPISNLDQLINIGLEKEDDNINSKIYYFTHLVIAASKFYTTRLSGRDQWLLVKVFSVLENLVESYFDEITLDVKLEYLLAIKILNTKTRFMRKILDEVEKSISPEGYIDDSRSKKHSFKSAEHRNMLYLGVVKWDGVSSYE